MIIEVDQFTLRDGVKEDDFLTADARYQEDVAYQLSGLRRRSTARGADGQWVVLTWWESGDLADEGVRAARELAANFDFNSLIDTDSRKVLRYETL